MQAETKPQVKVKQPQFHDADRNYAKSIFPIDRSVFEKTPQERGDIYTKRKQYNKMLHDKYGSKRVSTPTQYTNIFKFCL